MKNLKLITILLIVFRLGKAFYFAEDDKLGTFYPKNFEIELTNKNWNVLPDKFTLKLDANSEDFKINFKKEPKTNPDIFVVGKKGDLNKYKLKNPEEYQHYVDLTGQAHATLVKNSKNSTDSFRLIAKISSLTELNTTYEVYPIKVSNRQKRYSDDTKQFYHAFKKRTLSHEVNSHAFINPLDAKDYIIDKSKLKNSKPTSKQTRIEDGTLVFNVETLIVTDSSIYEDHKRISNSEEKDFVFNQMKIYFSHLMHSVNQKYQNSLENDQQMKINVLLTNFLFFTDPAETTWTDPSITGESQYSTYDGKEVIVASPALSNFKDYMESKTFPFTYDHAMALLKKDLWGEPNQSPEQRKGIAGLAYLDGICSSIRYSISEENGGFSSIYTIAHELGHNLGSVHDGEAGAESCPLTDYYIMTPVQNFDKIQNMQRFSTCSIAQFKAFLISGGSSNENSNCLMNTPLSLPQEFLNVNFSLTGQVYDPNEQCKMLNGNNASFCQFLSDKICSELFCRYSNDEQSCYSSSPAVEGTTCASGKICILGVCTSSSLVSDSVCPFGDGLVQTGTQGINLLTRYVTCGEFISILAKNGKSEAAFCSSDSGQTSCCSTCLKYKYADCNDKYSNCADFKDSCESNFNSGPVKDECCATCQTRPVTCSSNPNVCLNNGQCFNTSVVTNLIGYKCECLNGFTGYNCEKSISTTIQPTYTTTDATTIQESSFKSTTTSLSTESTTIQTSTMINSTSTDSTTAQSSTTFKSTIISSITYTTSDTTEKITTNLPPSTSINNVISFIISIILSVLRNLFSFF